MKILWECTDFPEFRYFTQLKNPMMHDKRLRSTFPVFVPVTARDIAGLYISN